ncbi:MAG: TrgA family protein [Paracoccaceae bacterium]
MPTAARLVAAVCVCVLSILLSRIVQDIYLRDVAPVNFGYFMWINAGLGAVIGWGPVGKRAKADLSAALSNGVTGVILLIGICIFAHAFLDMMRRSLKNEYDTLFEAILAVFQIIAAWAPLLVDQGFIIVAGLGGCIVGILSSYAARRWR